MREVATTLSDYVLAAAGVAALAGILARPAAVRGLGPAVFFTGFSLAALCGGTWHGFFSAPDAADTLLQRVIWWLSLVFTGVSAAGLALIGVELLSDRRRTVLIAATAGFVALFAMYVWTSPQFVASLVASAIGTVACIAGLIHYGRRVDARPAAMAIGALLLAAAAGVGQQMGLAFDPVTFDRNATYHVFVLIALGAFYAGLRRIAF